MVRLRYEDLKVLDEDQVPRTVSRSQWLDLFLRIEKGKALAIPHDKAPVSSVREAVKRLKETKRLAENYTFVSRKQQDGTVVSYVVNSAWEAQKPDTGRRKRDKSRISLDETKKLILSKGGDYENSLSEIQSRFYGKPLSSRYDLKEYHRSYNIARRARQEIENELGGKFVEELLPDGTKVYRLKK
jgi:hypothetical protein